MDRRTIRTIAVGVGAGALVLGMAAPAMAAETITVTELPKRVVMTTADTIQVQVAWPDGFACGTEGVSWLARVPGKQDAVLLATNPATNPVNPCTQTGLAVTVTSNSNSAKKNAVVKLIGTNANGEKAVLTMSVKVTGKTGNPGKGKKPS